MEKKLDINPEYPLAMHMLNLESELQPDSAESTYVRVIVWNTMPTSKHLQVHFDKFDLLQLEEERLANGKFDIVQKSESTYERFLYAHYPEQQSFVTIFVKVNFNKKKNPSSMRNFLRKVNEVLNKYGLINTVEIEHDQIDSKDSSLSASNLCIWGCVLFFIYSIFIPPKTKKTEKQLFEEFADNYLKLFHGRNTSPQDMPFLSRLKYIVDYEDPASDFITYEHSEQVFYCLNKYNEWVKSGTKTSHVVPTLSNTDWNDHWSKLIMNDSDYIRKADFIGYIATLDDFKNYF